MKHYPTYRAARLLLTAVLLFAVPAVGEDIHVMTSGAFTAAYKELVPLYEQKTHDTIVSAYGASMGNAPDSIPTRLDRGEPADVVILAASALDQLIEKRQVFDGSRVDLVRSAIGIAVPHGAPKPDISTVEGLKQALLHAKSVAYSASASGVYVSTELFPRLGIAEQMAGKARRTTSQDGTGPEAARGEVDIAIQQISELLPVKGIDYVGPLPAEVQRITIFSAGIATGAKNPQGAKALIQFLSSAEAVPAIKESGLEPVSRGLGH